MKYSELIKELDYWRTISEEEDPEVVLVYDDEPYEISIVDPSEGIENERAIGLYL